MVELISPTVRMHESWLGARDEWAPGAVLHGHGVEVSDDVETMDGFAEYLARLARFSDESLPVPADRVHATYWWIAEGDTFLGAITLRYRLNAFLLRAGGHIGYGVRPSARGRGVASWALGAVLPRARDRGLERVLITCQDTNVASARTIERNGGVLEDIRTTEFGATRRYWIDLLDPTRRLSGRAPS
jgi:predicted acetyltransferase